MEMAGEGSKGNILIGRPGTLHQDAGAVKADVNCGSDLVRGILETVELEQQLHGGAAFSPDRRTTIAIGMRLSMRPLNMLLMAIRSGASRVAEFCDAG